MIDFYTAINQVMLEYLYYYQVIIYANLYNKIEDKLLQVNKNIKAIKKYIILPSSYNRRDQAMA